MPITSCLHTYFQVCLLVCSVAFFLTNLSCLLTPLLANTSADLFACLLACLLTLLACLLACLLVLACFITRLLIHLNAWLLATSAGMLTTVFHFLPSSCLNVESQAILLKIIHEWCKIEKYVGSI